MTPLAKKPPTFDAQFVLRDASVGRRLLRDLKVLRFLGMVLLFWATKGRRIRRNYRAAVASGEAFVLEKEVLPLLQGTPPPDRQPRGSQPRGSNPQGSKP